MTTRRVFVSPSEAIELVFADNQSAIKATMGRDQKGVLHVFVQSQPFTKVWCDATPREQALLLGEPL